jgi:hypothetical protein
VRRPVLALLVLVLAALGAVLAVRACGGPPTDEERIRGLLADAARAAEDKRIGDVVRDVSERFAGQGLDKRGVKQLVALHVLRGAWVAVTISGERLEVRGDRARAVVDVVMLRSGKGRPLSELLPEQATVHRFDLHLAREEEGWKVTGGAWRPITLEEASRGPPELGGW